MTGPRADFTCLSAKCKGEQGQAVYELPVASARCPVCGSKRIVRVWSGKAPGIVRSRALHRKVSAAGARVMDRHAEGKAAQRRIEKDARELRALGVGVPGGVGMGSTQQALGWLGVAVQAGGARPGGSPPAPLARVIGRRVATNIMGSDGA